MSILHNVNIVASFMIWMYLLAFGVFGDREDAIRPLIDAGHTNVVFSGGTYTKCETVGGGGENKNIASVKLRGSRARGPWIP